MLLRGVCVSWFVEGERDTNAQAQTIRPGLRLGPWSSRRERSGPASGLRRWGSQHWRREHGGEDVLWDGLDGSRQQQGGSSDQSSEQHLGGTRSEWEERFSIKGADPGEKGGFKVANKNRG
jgi:hypothetical protein